MAAWDNVSLPAAPSTRDYAPPPIDFSQLGNLVNTYMRSREQMRDQDYLAQQRQREENLQRPINTTDPQQVVGELMRRGGAPYAASLIPFLQQQQPVPVSRLLSGGDNPSVPAPASNATPSSSAQLPIVAKPNYTPVSDASNSVMAIVTSVLPENSTNTGQVAVNLAKSLGVDPNAALTPEQEARASRYIAAYAQRNGIEPPLQNSGATSQPASAGMAAQDASRAAPSTSQGIVLPQGYTDPVAAVRDLRAEAARYSASPNPRAQGQSKELNAWADRIEESLKPRVIGGALVGPQGNVLYQPSFGSAGPALDANAEIYYQTGKFPQNISRGIQGNNERLAIQQRAVELHPEDQPSAWPTRWQQFAATGSGGGAQDIAESIKSGLQPPTLTGLQKTGPLVREILAKDKFDLAKAQQQWTAAQKQIQSLNGPQMTRYAGLAGSVVNTIDEVKRLAEDMNNSGVPLLNKVKMAAYVQTEGNSPKGQLASRYMAAVNTLKEEFANLAQGGYAPTEAAWKLANDQINGNYGVKQLGASLDEVQRLIRYRIQGIPNFQTLGPMSGNRYFGREQPTQETQPTSVAPSGDSGGGALPPPPPPGFQIVK